MIDPNPQDIGMIDFYRPDGTPVAVVRGDPRQLNDATFHAGTNSGSEYEYVDTFNKLHFYVLSTSRDADGVLHYRVAVRRAEPGDPFARGVGVGNATKTPQREGFLATCTFPVTNTGQAGTGMFDSDVYRLAATLEQRRLEGDAAERARRREGGPDGAGAGARAPRPAHRRGRRTDDGDAHRQVRGRFVEDGDADVRGARARHDARRQLADGSMGRGREVPPSLRLP